MFLRHRYMADYSKGIMAHGAYIANIRRLSSVAPPTGWTPPPSRVRSDGLKQARCLLQVILLPQRQAVELLQGHAKNLLEVSGREVSLKREAEHFLQLEDLRMGQPEPSFLPPGGSVHHTRAAPQI